MMKKSIVCCLLAFLLGDSCNAFLSMTPQSSHPYGPTRTRLESDPSSSSDLPPSGQPPQDGTQPRGRLERLSVKVRRDGTIEVTVKGVKGPDCIKIAEEFNELLGGTIIRREPTEEMFEEEVGIDQTLTNKNVGPGDDSWEGASSW